METVQLPIIEPLSEATKSKLVPLRLGKNDYLEIWMDPDDRNFFMRSTCFRPERPGDEGVIPSENYRTTLTGETVVSYGSWPSYAANQFFKRIPEANPLDRKGLFNDRNTMNVAATDYSAVVLHHSWPRDRLIFLNETANVTYHYLLKRFLAQTARANLQAEFKINKVLPEMPSDFRPHPNPDLRLADYQKLGLLFQLQQEASAMLMDRGTGKTPVTIARICLEAKRYRAGKMRGETARMMRVLIVVPNQVRVNWRKEFERFATVPGKITIIKGGRMKRLRLLTQAVTSEDDCAFSVCIIGFDTIPNDVEAFEKVPWDLVCLDESHYIKSYQTKRAKALRLIRDNSVRRVILTGTFIGNSIMDAYSQLEFLGDGLSGFSSYKNYRAFHGKFAREAKRQKATGRQRGGKLLGSENIPLMRERLARMAYQISKEEAGLNLPDKVPVTWEVNMTPRQFEFYQRLAQQLAIEIEADMAKGEERRLTAEHILTKLLRLQQICSGFITWDAVQDPETGLELQSKKTEQISGNNPKINAVVEMLLDPQEDPKSKTVIWCCFIEDIKSLSRRLSIEGIKHGCYFGATKDKEREWIIEQFNGEDDEFKVIIANPQTAGEGLNLIGYDPSNPAGSECFCGHEIFYSVNWSYIQRAQAEDRAHRRGTRMPVRITDLMIADTIDEEIRNRVLAKEQNAWTIQDVRDVLDKVLDLDIEFGNGEQ